MSRLMFICEGEIGHAIWEDITRAVRILCPTCGRTFPAKHGGPGQPLPLHERYEPANRNL